MGFVGLSSLRLVDYGTAPVVHVSALVRVDHMGTETLLAFCAPRTTMIDGRLERAREVILNIVAPTDAIGPGIELILETFGAGIMIPAAGHAMRRLLL